MRLSLIIQAVDRATAPVRRIRAAFAGFGSRVRSAAREAGGALDRIVPAGAAARLRRFATQVRALAGRAGIGAISVGARAARSALTGMLKIAGGATVGALAGGVGLLGYLTGGIIPLASKFEQFQVVLENTEGSAEKARAAMSWVREFGKTTPYEVSHVMEAFVAMKAYGLDPMGGALESLGNAASGMNKELMQAVEMLADAQTGEFERLKEFGIRASAQGEKVSFTYMKAGKEVTVTAKKSAAEIQRAVLGIFDARFAGMMDRQSRTLQGLWSNIQDMVAGFQLDVADAGFFDFVKKKVQELLDRINVLAKNGTLERWAKKISIWLTEMGTKAADFIQNTDWNKVGADIKTVAGAAWDLVSAISRVVGWMQKLNALAGQTKPPGWWSAWGKGWPQFLFEKGANALGEAVRPERDRQPQGAERGWSVTRGGAKTVPWRAPPRALAPPLRQAPGALLRRQPSAEVGGKVQVELRTQPGVDARVRHARSDNPRVPIAITRGPVLAG